MDILVKLTVPNSIYRFYERAARYVAGKDAEDLMTDALKAYTGMVQGEKEEEET